MGSRQELLYMEETRAGMDPMMGTTDEQELLDLADRLIHGELNPGQNSMALGGPEPEAQVAAVMAQQQPTLGTEPWVEITEQPKSRGLRFRYECEGRSAGSVPGEHSTTENRTYPTIKIHNHEPTNAIIVVSCVTKDNPPKPHPHSLVGKDCGLGVCTVHLSKTSTASFPNLGIQCCKKRDVGKSLQERLKNRVDPFSTGIPKDVNAVDLSTVKLCFQVFFCDERRKVTKVLQPVVSQPIYDKKTVNDLVVVRVSKHSGSCRGGDEVFLLCEKVNKEDIEVRFYEETPDGVSWEGRGEFGQNDVHRQFAIVFKTPAYRRQDIAQPVTVFMQLRRTSDGETSEPTPFQYTPENLDPEGIEIKRKRKRMPFHNFITDNAGLPEAKGDGKSQLREKILKARSRVNMVKQEPAEHVEDFDNAGGFPGQQQMGGAANMSSLLRRPPGGQQAFNNATSTSTQPTFQSGGIIVGPPSASMGAPGMPNMTFHAQQATQVTMSTGVGGAPATFANLNAATAAAALNQQTTASQIKHEQHNATTTSGDFNAQSILNELSAEGGGSTCNSMNIDSGLLNYITDSLDPDQSDSLTKFLNQEMENSAAAVGVAGNMQPEALMGVVPLVEDNLHDLHQQLRDLNQ